MYDFAVVGGGIVGLSTAYALQRRYPRARLLLVEKEARWAAHQTGHNSGVIHSGIYYKPGSLKARLAVEGRRALITFCREHGVPHDICGKVIVATETGELPRLDDLHQRGLANGLNVTRIDGARLREIEPHAAGIAALRVPETGIVDYVRVSETLAHLVAAAGGDLRLGTRVRRVVERNDGLSVETDRGDFPARFLVGCAGLHSDRLARQSGLRPPLRIVPFRGEYYELRPEKRHLVRHLIYPVPNPAFPFLGVHFTRMIDGSVHAGPNAVLGGKREGYRKSDVSLRDLADVFSFPAFWRLAGAHWREGRHEITRSFSKAAFVRSLRRLVPEITGADIEPTHAGVRAQALMNDGRLADDFVILTAPRAVHVCNAPSPAATASLAIGETVCGYVAERVPSA